MTKRLITSDDCNDGNGSDIRISERKAIEIFDAKTGRVPDVEVTDSATGKTFSTNKDAENNIRGWETLK